MAIKGGNSVVVKAIAESGLGLKTISVNTYEDILSPSGGGIINSVDFSDYFIDTSYKFNENDEDDFFLVTAKSGYKFQHSWSADSKKLEVNVTDSLGIPFPLILSNEVKVAMATNGSYIAYFDTSKKQYRVMTSTKLVRNRDTYTTDRYSYTYGVDGKWLNIGYPADTVNISNENVSVIFASEKLFYGTGNTEYKIDGDIDISFKGVELKSTIVKGKSVSIDETVQELDATTFPSTFQTYVKGIKTATISLTVLEYNDFILSALEEDIPLILTYQNDKNDNEITYKGVLVKESMKAETGSLIEKTIEFKGERI